ncbi:MAG: hypothetical protein K9K66_16065 [Desulfarculaceae bacterium]|nr:hypothetical protein [Desulfarculaceae bacterium]MCF8071632.1 hypothetical protein [Desulfarculaceae bacterium]MCF8103171.1 hypothetical protein [Desulfarculaceae bacterium]MCF8114911.1 hypothetical protein [Desulfarculaceae bacterium]
MIQEQTLEQVFLNKPELPQDLPAWMLPPEMVSRVAATPGAALVELAGRDSVAAALKAVEEAGLKLLVPTYVYTGSEYGRWQEVPRAWERLAGRLPSGVELTPLLVMGSPRLWRALNGRHLQTLTRRFGFSPVCPGCHLYLHAARIPLAKALGGIPVVAGERLSHDGRQKLNQVAASLKAFRQLYEHFGLELLLPLAEVESGRAVEEILGLDWPEGGEQLGCVFSGNYLEPEGELAVSPERLADYFERFALPLARRTVRGWLEDASPDPMAEASELLAV